MLHKLGTRGALVVLQQPETRATPPQNNFSANSGVTLPELKGLRGKQPKYFGLIFLHFHSAL